MIKKSENRSLVIGSTGQVGNAIVSLLDVHAIPARRSSIDDAILSIDLSALAREPSLAPNIINRLNLDAVYCIGGATDVERCEVDPIWAMETNCSGPAALAAASKQVPFVYLSTDYIFDGCAAPGHSAGPYSETDLPNPISVYGRSKLEGERRVFDAHPNPLIIRTTVVYGPDPNQKNFLYTLKKRLSLGEKMRVPIDQISSPTFNGDLAAATVELVKVRASGIFNVCGPECISRYDFAMIACEIMGFDQSLVLPTLTRDLKQRALRPLKAGMKIEKLLSSLQHTKMRSVRDGIIDWIKHENFDERTSSGHKH